MTKELVDKFIENKESVMNELKEKQWSSYENLLKVCLKYVSSEFFEPDLEKIHTINDGDYQGSYLFVIPETDYQPSRYIITGVQYGSCSGCDTLQGISEYSSDAPSEQQVRDYYTLCLHIVQKMVVYGV